MDNYSHTSVMRDECIAGLSLKKGGIYLDGTLGLGGHSEAIANALAGNMRIIGLDRDEDAIAIAKQRLSPFGSAVSIYHMRFSEYQEALSTEGISHLDGVLLDVGVSSLQLDTPERGFSFRNDAPLDMRMDANSSECSAKTLLARIQYDELRQILHEYGEEPLASKVARAILSARDKAPIQTTLQLATIVEQAYPAKWRHTARMHPATRTFQALRIAVNNELEELATFFTTIIPLLSTGARIAVISFHSLEDRIVKHALREYTKTCICPPHLYRCECSHTPELRIITKRPLLPTAEETARNPRSRSAKLRIAEKQ